MCMRTGGLEGIGLKAQLLKSQWFNLVGVTQRAYGRRKKRPLG